MSKSTFAGDKLYTLILRMGIPGVKVVACLAESMATRLHGGRNGVMRTYDVVHHDEVLPCARARWHSFTATGIRRFPIGEPLRVTVKLCNGGGPSR